MSDAPKKPPAKVVSLRSRLREANQADTSGSGGYLPDDCPVTPLGVQGELCWYIDGVGQLVAIPRKAHSKLAIHGLFSPHTSYCRDAKKTWAKTIRVKDEDGDDREVVVDFRPDTVAQDLMAACASRMSFNPVGRVRGRGVWLGEDEDLVCHHGGAIHVKEAVLKPGRHNDWVYPRGVPRALPARDSQVAGAGGPAARIFADLGCWNWSRPGMDQQLLLGWICATFYCGALDWRPHGWINGPRAAGKSTLFRYLARLLHEPSGCVMTGNTTAAGIRSQLGDDALGVLFDDAEAGDTPQRVVALVELMRSASSGSLVLRGTADHGTASFSVRFMGLVNSILRPPLTSQDLSRLLLLNMRALEPGAREPVMARSELGLLGQQLFRRMLDAWPRFRAEFPRWKAALQNAGLPGRGPEQYGILLAAQDVALHDGPADTDTMDEICARVAQGTAADRAEEMPEWRRCIERITTTIVPAYRGGAQRTLGNLIALAAWSRVWRDAETGEDTIAPTADRDDANRALASYGLRVVLDVQQGRPLRRWRHDPLLPPALQGDGRATGWLAVANSNAALNDAVFRRSHYAAASGTSGGWKAALESCDQVQKGREMRFGGPASRCVLVPLDLVLDGDAESGEAME